jgi:PPOX class probable F420-dependent enzyme
MLFRHTKLACCESPIILKFDHRSKIVRVYQMAPPGTAHSNLIIRRAATLRVILAGNTGPVGRLAVKLSEEIYTELMNKWPVARLSTITPDARPHTIPIVFCEYERIIYAPLDGKRKRHTRLQRLTNLVTNPQATLLLDEYTPDWQSLWWVRVDGDADWFEPDPREAKLIADCLLQKYPQYQDPLLMFDTTAYLRLRPTRISAWAQSDLPGSITPAVDRR